MLCLHIMRPSQGGTAKKQFVQSDNGPTVLFAGQMHYFSPPEAISDNTIDL